MRNTKRTMTIAAAMTLAFGLFAPAFAQAEDPEAYGDGYQSGAYGRIRSADNGGTIIRADGEGGEPDAATVNAPLFPGDTLRTDGSQRVEVQLAGGSIVRIDTNGEVVFQALPDPSAKFKDNTVLALQSGVIRIDSNLGEKDEFRIDTRAASVYLLGQGEFRLATDDRGGLRVASLRGVAEVVGNDASVLVRGGTGTSVAPGSVPDTPRAYVASSSDGFDRWCASRDDSYRAHDVNLAQTEEIANVPDEVQPYQAELSNNGSWATDPTYGTVWYPTGVSAGWRPYNNGYWSYGPGGYFWVSYEPWGWAPYHYGNWQWTGYRGWGWVPGPVFAGAWVSWSWGSLYVGWAPLDFWGRPGWAGGAYYSGYYDPGCWTFLGYNNINTRYVSRYAVPIGTVHDDLRHATVVSRAPQVDPRRIAQSPAVRQRALRQVADDQAAHLRPVQADNRPERNLRDVQNQMMRRPQQGSPIARAQRSTIATPGVDPRTSAPRARRIFDDPRSSARTEIRPETRDDVRDLYQRMSKPRETRGQDTPNARESNPSVRGRPSRTDSPRDPSARSQAPQAQPQQRYQSPRGQAPQEQPRRMQPSPRGQAPQSQPQQRYQSPREQAPPSQPQQRYQSPRVQAPQAQPQQRYQTPRGQAPQAQPQRMQQAPRAQAPRAQAPQAQAPRAQAPRAQTPRVQAPRGQAPQGQGAPRAKPNHGDKH